MKSLSDVLGKNLLTPKLIEYLLEGENTRIVFSVLPFVQELSFEEIVLRTMRRFNKNAITEISLGSEQILISWWESTEHVFDKKVGRCNLSVIISDIYFATVPNGINLRNYIIWEDRVFDDSPQFKYSDDPGSGIKSQLYVDRILDPPALVVQKTVIDYLNIDVLKIS